MTYNTKCDPLNNKINVPQLSPIPPMPGFGLDLSFPMPQLPSLEGIPEDIMKYVNMLKFPFPGGAFLKYQIQSLQERITAIIASLLGYLNLFLGMYFILLALIELILCIINILCGLMNPFSVIRRVKKLKRKCIPLFIKICFPFFALLALLLALIAILIALIEYIIALIKRLIEQLLKNVLKLKYILQQGNSDAALSIISKIADLLCLFEHVFVLLAAIDSILELIQTKWKKILKVCKSGGGGNGEDENDTCCDAICANFLTEPISQINDPLEIWYARSRGFHSTLCYTNPVLGSPYPSLFASMVIPIRNECVYLSDDNLDDTLSFNNILSSPGVDNIMFTFFPPFPITTLTERSKIPYFADVSLMYDPSDGYGLRFITVTDCIVTNVILDAPLDVVNGSIVNANKPKGYLALDGGYYYDRLGILHTLPQILRDYSTLQPSADGNGSYFYLLDITYQLKINYDALLSYSLITADCLPSMILEDQHLATSMYRPLHLSLGGTGGPNGIGGVSGTMVVDRVVPDGGIVLPDGSIVPGMGVSPENLFDKIPAIEDLTPEEAAAKAAVGTFGGVNSLGVLDITLPDVAGTIQQLENSLNSYRNNITEESTTQLEIVMIDLLTKLQGQANTTYGQLLTASVDAYSTTKSLEPEVQFVTDKIVVSVTPTSLDNLSLQNLVGSFGTNDTVNETLASKFTAKPSLGFITKFNYDGYGNFTADLTTNVQGDGYIDIYYDGQLIPTVISPDNLSLAPSISTTPLAYSFIGFSTHYDGMLPSVRRDDTDTANPGN